MGFSTSGRFRAVLCVALLVVVLVPARPARAIVPLVIAATEIFVDGAYMAVNALGLEAAETSLVSSAGSSLAASGVDATAGETIALRTPGGWAFTKPWQGLGAGVFALARRVLDYFNPPVSGSHTPSGAFTVVVNPGDAFCTVHIPPGSSLGFSEGHGSFTMPSGYHVVDADTYDEQMSWYAVSVGEVPTTDGALKVPEWDAFFDVLPFDWGGVVSGSGGPGYGGDFSPTVSQMGSDPLIHVWSESLLKGRNYPYSPYDFHQHMLSEWAPQPNTASGKGSALASVPAGDSLMLGKPGLSPYVPTGSTFTGVVPAAGSPVAWQNTDGTIGAPVTTGAPDSGITAEPPVAPTPAPILGLPTPAPSPTTFVATKVQPLLDASGVQEVDASGALKWVQQSGNATLSGPAGGNVPPDDPGSFLNGMFGAFAHKFPFDFISDLANYSSGAETNLSYTVWHGVLFNGTNEEQTFDLNFLKPWFSAAIVVLELGTVVLGIFLG
jgi:hypothetical protein